MALHPTVHPTGPAVRKKTCYSSGALSDLLGIGLPMGGPDVVNSPGDPGRLLVGDPFAAGACL